MSAAEVLRVARAAGVEVAVEGDDLALSASHEPPPRVLELLAEHKAEVVELLTATPRRGPNPPAPGGLVARVIEAGGETSVGGHRPDGSLWKFAYLPDDIDPELVAELKTDDWSISAIEEMRRYVADTMRRARMLGGPSLGAAPTTRRPGSMSRPTSSPLPSLVKSSQGCET